MEDLSRRNLIKNIIGGALIAATPSSIVSAQDTPNQALSSKSVVTKTKDGQEIRLTVVEGKRVLVQKVAKGKITDVKPSGTFTLKDGKTIIVKNGVIIGGTSGGGPTSPFQAFALLGID